MEVRHPLGPFQGRSEGPHADIHLTLLGEQTIQGESWLYPLSDLYDQEMGVPQSSILSVNLFRLKINDIVQCVNPGTESSLFVDDAACCQVQANQIH